MEGWGFNKLGHNFKRMHTRKPPISIAKQSQEIYNRFPERELIILCGKNNSGKTYLLKDLYKRLGVGTSYLGPNRYQNFNILGVVAGKRDKHQEYQNWLRSINQNQNIDNSPWNLQQAIAELSNEKRETLFKVVGELLGSQIEIQMSDPNNDMSQRFVSVDGYNISYTSSGFRLITSILTSLLDPDYKYFLIDEPELGISPEIQGALSEFLLNKKNRENYFPHLEKLVIATHSPVFIDKMDITNNYYIDRFNHEIIIKTTNSIQEINSLQFFLLGNRFETLFLPSIIVLVEGKCDYKLFSQLTKKLHPEQNISIIQCNGDSKISEYINMAKNMFGDLNKSPYHNRIMVVLDKVHQNGLGDKLIKQGIPEQNVIIWNENGIEYYYPKELMIKIFGNYDNIKINDDIVSVNGVTKKKNELVEEITLLMNGNENFNKEFEEKFLNQLEALVY